MKTQTLRRNDAVECTARVLAILGIAVPLWRVIGMHHLGEPSFVTYALLGPLALHLQMLWNTKRIAELGEIVIVAGIYWTAYSYGPTWDPTGSVLALAGSFLGVGSLLVNGAHMIWSEDKNRVKYFLPGAAVVVSTTMLPTLFALLTIWKGHTSFEAWLYAFDNQLGVQAGFAMGRLFARSTPLRLVCSVVYPALPLAFMILYGASTRPCKADELHLHVHP
jgi:hypothetical protein